MSRTIAKIMPMATVVALVSWWCWPYLEGPDTVAASRPKDELPRITDPLLSPDVEPTAPRDPFRPVHQEKTDSLEREPLPTPPPAQPKPPAEDQIRETLSGLVLGATYIQGDRRAALIDGRVYRQGEPLELSTPTPEPCVVAGIFPDKVLILHRGRTVEVTYPDPASSAEPTTAARARP